MTARKHSKRAERNRIPCGDVGRSGGFPRNARNGVSVQCKGGRIFYGQRGDIGRAANRLDTARRDISRRAVCKRQSLNGHLCHIQRKTAYDRHPTPNVQLVHLHRAISKQIQHAAINGERRILAETLSALQPEYDAHPQALCRVVTQAVHEQLAAKVVIRVRPKAPFNGIFPCSEGALVLVGAEM